MEKVIKFNQDNDFYIKLAEKSLRAKEYPQAVKHLTTVIASGKADSETFFLLGKTYQEMLLLHISNTYLFKSLGKNNQKAYFELANNFDKMDESTLANIYFNKCIMEGENTQLGILSRNSLKNKESKQVLFKDAEEKEKIFEAQKYLAQSDVKKAIDILESLKTKTPELRSNLALIYFINNDCDKAINTITENDTRKDLSVEDLSNLVVFYLKMEDSFNVKKYSALLDKKETITVDDLYKKALTFANIGEHKKACGYLEEMLIYTPYNCVILLIYSQCLYNLKQYDKAKDVLLLLTKIDPLKSVYKYYLKVYEKKNPANKIFYLNDLPSEEIANRVLKITQLLNLEEDKLNRLIENDIIYDYVEWACASGGLKLKWDLLNILSVTQNLRVCGLVDFLLLSTIINTELKKAIIKKRILSCRFKEIRVTFDNIFYCFKTPNKKILTEPLLSAYAAAQMYLLNQEIDEDISIVHIVEKVAKYFFAKGPCQDTYVITGVILWGYAIGKNTLKLSNICKDLVVSEDEIEKIVNEIFIAIN